MGLLFGAPRLFRTHRKPDSWSHSDVPVERRPRDPQRFADVVDFERLVLVELLCQPNLCLISGELGASAVTSPSSGSRKPRVRPFLNQATFELRQRRRNTCSGERIELQAQILIVRRDGRITMHVIMKVYPLNPFFW